MRKQYKAAHQISRIHRARGLAWPMNPTRLAPGWPGIFVGSDGQAYGWYGFDRMFEPLERNKPSLASGT